MKTCCICNNKKPLDQYCKRQASADGLEYQCKSCKKATRAPTIRCVNKGCQNKAIRYQDICRPCSRGLPAQCVFNGCKEPRKDGRKICEEHYRKERKRTRKDTMSHAVECATDGCHRKTINKHCQNCTRDEKLAYLKTSEKACIGECKKVKKLIEFGARAASSDGRCATCRLCSHERHKVAMAKRHAKRTDNGYQAQIKRYYMDQHESLGFVCSNMLGVKLNDTIQPCPERTRP